MRNLVRASWLAGIVLVIGGLYYSCSRPRNYGPMPNVILEDLDGKKVSLSEFKGKVILVNFWATWCPPCRAEIPSFIELYDAHKDEGFVIVGFAVDREGKAKVAPFAAEQKINYPVLPDPEGVAVDAFRPGAGIPTTFLVGRDGQIRDKLVGLRPHEYFEARIKKLLAEPVPRPADEDAGG